LKQTQFIKLNTHSTFLTQHIFKTNSFN